MNGHFKKRMADGRAYLSAKTAEGAVYTGDFFPACVEEREVPSEKALINLSELTERLRVYGRFRLCFCGGGEYAAVLLVSAKQQVQSRYMLPLHQGTPTGGRGRSVSARGAIVVAPLRTYPAQVLQIRRIDYRRSAAERTCASLSRRTAV